MKTRKQQARDKTQAFTLKELVAVVAAVGLLILVVLPALAGTRVNSVAARCQYNLKQLMVAWSMFASDNNDQLVGNPGCQTWAAGQMDWFGGADNFVSAKFE